MKITKKEFSPGLLEKVDLIRKDMDRAYNFSLEHTTHVHLQCEKIASLTELPGTIVQCGVWKGASIFAAALFCEQEGIKKKIFGFDTFGGFPNKEIYAYDHPEYFKILLECESITPENYEKASFRTNKFTNLAHLTTEHFYDVGEVFGNARKFENIEFVQGLFADTLPKFKEPIAVLYLDCDLYQSYQECLVNLYGQVVEGGAVVFDEYYSLKYPGARVAVDAFFKDKKGHFEIYKTRGGFERWCFMKSNISGFEVENYIQSF